MLWLSLAAFAALIAYGYTRRHPEDMPWTRLDLSAPVGAFTGRKLVGLTDDAPRCQRLLTRAGVRFVSLAPVAPVALVAPVGARACGYDDGVRLATGGSRGIVFAPAGLGTSCAVAAAVTLWEWNVLQPAANRHFGSRVVAIEHFGSYNCRRIGSGSTGAFSEHATADAVDIAAFRLADGTRISVLRDWNGDGEKSAFLRDVRDGACDLFSTVLGPDYNRAHRDHLHLDQASRGALGWRACR